MKNIHIILTDKPSRLFDFMTALVLLKKASPNDSGTNQNIYITSDEEIKEGDWIYIKTPNICGGNIVAKHLGFGRDCWSKNILTNTTDEKGYHPSHCKKIILTTDRDLIKDNVQAIEDDFLEWLVKNPSCEEVETKLIEFEVDMGLGGRWIEYGSYYEIIIPKEEPKQELERGITITHVGKQETLEESAEKFLIRELNLTKIQAETLYSDYIKAVVKFHKWQAKRMYSEEDMIAFAEFVAEHPDKNRNHKGEMLHAKSKYDGAERTIDLLEDFKKK
jgi:hypothetical protein